MSRPRFVVRGVAGYAIGKNGVRAGRRFAPTYYIADTLYCWREVATFPNTQGGRGGDAWRRAKADQLCAELNAETSP